MGLGKLGRGQSALENLAPDFHLHSPLLSAPPSVVLLPGWSEFSFSRARGRVWNGHNVCVLGFSVTVVRAFLPAAEFCTALLLSRRSPCPPSVNMSSSRRHIHPFLCLQCIGRQRLGFFCALHTLSSVSCHVVLVPVRGWNSFLAYHGPPWAQWHHFCVGSATIFYQPVIDGTSVQCGAPSYGPSCCPPHCTPINQSMELHARTFFLDDVLLYLSDCEFGCASVRLRPVVAMIMCRNHGPCGPDASKFFTDCGIGKELRGLSSFLIYISMLCSCLWCWFGVHHFSLFCADVSSNCVDNMAPVGALGNVIAGRMWGSAEHASLTKLQLHCRDCVGCLTVVSALGPQTCDCCLLHWSPLASS